jgi:hypothetical protein
MFELGMVLASLDVAVPDSPRLFWQQYVDAHGYLMTIDSSIIDSTNSPCLIQDALQEPKENSTGSFLLNCQKKATSTGRGLQNTFRKVS